MRIAVAGGTGVVGRHTVAALREADHEPVVLSRANGIDLTGAAAGLADALAGCAAVIDVTSVSTTRASVSERFFGGVTRTLLEAERAAGVGHHVALSIVGAAEAPAAYYAGKALQERLVREARTGWSILRATQFHEFAAQLAARGKPGRLRLVPAMTSQPVAAAEVGAALAEIAAGEPRGLDRDLGGPRVEDMPTLVRRYLAATGDRGRVLTVPLPGRWGRALRDGTLLAGPDARLGAATAVVRNVCAGARTRRRYEPPQSPAARMEGSCLPPRPSPASSSRPSCPSAACGTRSRARSATTRS